MSSTRLFDAASSSTTSSARPSRMATHEIARVVGLAVDRVQAVDGLGDDARGAGLAGAARSDEEQAVAKPVESDRVAQRLDDCVLGDDVAEGLRAPTPIERLMGGRRDGLIRRRRRGLWGHPCSLGGHEERVCRAPAVDRRRSRAQRSDRLGPGRSAAPGEQRLSLLPSGPDEVHASPLRGTRSSTSISPSASANAGLGWEFSPAGADCRYRAPLVPRLARRGNSTCRGSSGWRRGWDSNPR